MAWQTWAAGLGALVLICTPALAGRDPFAPPAEPACADSAHWHPGGILGDPARRDGWLRDANGRWLRATPGQPLGQGWRTEAVTEDHIRLAAEGEACKGRPPVLLWLVPVKANNDKEI